MDLLSVDDLDIAVSTWRERIGLVFSENWYRDLAQCAQRNELTGRRLFEEVLEYFRPLHDVDRNLRVIEKTPLHVEHMAEIWELFPRARFVHIVRDPRNTISSLLRMPFVATTWIPWQAQRWNVVLERVRSFARAAPDAIHEIRYEDLVGRTEAVLGQVCKFVDLDYDSSMLVAFADQADRNILARESAWKENVQSGYIHRDPDVWSQRISHGEAWLIEWYTRKDFGAYGYAPGARLDLRTKAEIIHRVIAELRESRSTLGHCMDLAKKSLGVGDWLGSLRLMVLALCSDVGLVRNPTVRSVVVSGLRSGLSDRGRL
jgi:hypothetical protein